MTGLLLVAANTTALEVRSKVSNRTPNAEHAIASGAQGGRRRIHESLTRAGDRAGSWADIVSAEEKNMANSHASPSILDIQERMGWNDTTVLELLERFLVENKIYEDACDFMASIAE